MAKKISGYQKLKNRVEELERDIESLILRPNGSQAKAIRAIYKIDNE
jgi:hypothetical protein